MKVSFDIKLDAKHLYKFNIMQAYKGMQGILSILLPVLVFAYTAVTFGQVSLASTFVYAGLGILFLLYVPVSLWLRVKKLVTDPQNALSKTIHYDFEEERIHVSVEDQDVEFQWENVYQMKTAGDMVLVYTNRINAYILPEDQLSGEYDALRELAHKKLERYRFRMK